jgi:hypothetical protein
MVATEVKELCVSHGHAHTRGCAALIAGVREHEIRDGGLRREGCARRVVFAHGSPLSTRRDPPCACVCNVGKTSAQGCLAPGDLGGAGSRQSPTAVNSHLRCSTGSKPVPRRRRWSPRADLAWRRRGMGGPEWPPNSTTAPGKPWDGSHHVRHWIRRCDDRLRPRPFRRASTNSPQAAMRVPARPLSPWPVSRDGRRLSPAGSVLRESGG